MEKQISEEEVLALHQFCIKHRVVYYDVRLELVDHLASSIEAIWEKDDKIQFWDALNATYSGYGAMGFRNLMREKEEVVEKFLRRDLLNVFKAMFYWPNIKISLFFLLPSIFFFFLIDRGFATWSFVFCYSFCVLTFGYEIFLLIKASRMRKKMKFNLLCLQNYGAFVFSFITNWIATNGAIQLFFSGHDGSVILRFNKISYLIITFACIWSILMLLAKRKFMQDAYEEAKVRYPMAFEAVILKW